MESVLAGLQWDICLVYLDDIIVTGTTFENMLENLGKVFKRLKKVNLKLNAKKCCLFAKVPFSVFDFKTQYRPGLQYKNADTLSRIPCRQCGYACLNQLHEQSIDQTKDKQPECCVSVVKLTSENKDLSLNIKDMQDKDHELKQVLSWLEGTSKPVYKDISGLGYVMRSLLI